MEENVYRFFLWQQFDLRYFFFFFFSLSLFRFLEWNKYLCRFMEHAVVRALERNSFREKEIAVRRVSTNECNLSYLGHCIFWQRRGKHQSFSIRISRALFSPCWIWQSLGNDRSALPPALRFFKPDFVANPTHSSSLILCNCNYYLYRILLIEHNPSISIPSFSLRFYNLLV